MEYLHRWSWLGVFLLACAAHAAEPAQTGTVLLTLAEGVAPAEPGARETHDMELELTLRDGKFDAKVWGYGVSFNKADHEGELLSANGGALTVKMALSRDAWGPPRAGLG